MKKVLITGSNGLLGQKIIKQLQGQGVKIIAISKGANRLNSTDEYEYHSVDISDKNAISTLIAQELPDVIINSAAITNVDDCEVQKELCWLVNVTAVQHLIDAAEKHAAHLVHLSTDFVFDGKNGPYKEEAEVNPLSYYGKSKVAAEEILFRSKCSWAIVRTVLVYGTGEGLSRSNIVLWAFDALKKGEPLNVVDDQYRSPTLAEDLADGCIRVADQLATGVFNISGKDFMNIHEMITRVANHQMLDTNNINKISSKTLNQVAVRPPVTGLDITKAQKELGYNPRTFEEGLTLVKSQIN